MSWPCKTSGGICSHRECMPEPPSLRERPEPPPPPAYDLPPAAKIRAMALDAAARWSAGHRTAKEVLDAAVRFERYIRTGETDLPPEEPRMRRAF